MLRYSFDMSEAADDIVKAVNQVLDDGWRTGDIANAQTPSDKIIGTQAMGDLIVSLLA